MYCENCTCDSCVEERRLKREALDEKETSICGWYLITHLRSGKIYVGSASNVRTRRNAHMSDLKRGKHYCASLQEHYNIDPELEFKYILTEDREQAFDAEQLFLNEHFDTGVLFNTSKDARKSRKGIPIHPDTLKSVTKVFSAANESRRKKVSIDGVVYASIYAASQSLGIHRIKLQRRIAANDPKCFLVQDVHDM